MGFDLKTGWIIRGKGEDLAYELDGRKQQIYLELVGGLLAMGVVAALMNMHSNRILSPLSAVFSPPPSPPVRIRKFSVKWQCGQFPEPSCR